MREKGKNLGVVKQTPSSPLQRGSRDSVKWDREMSLEHRGRAHASSKRGHLEVA